MKASDIQIGTPHRLVASQSTNSEGSMFTPLHIGEATLSGLPYEQRALRCPDGRTIIMTKFNPVSGGDPRTVYGVRGVVMHGETVLDVCTMHTRSLLGPLPDAVEQMWKHNWYVRFAREQREAEFAHEERHKTRVRGDLDYHTRVWYDYRLALAGAISVGIPGTEPGDVMLRWAMPDPNPTTDQMRCKEVVLTYIKWLAKSGRLTARQIEDIQYFSEAANSSRVVEREYVPLVHERTGSPEECEAAWLAHKAGWKNFKYTAPRPVAV